jgi:hypothetical protein
MLMKGFVWGMHFVICLDEKPSVRRSWLVYHGYAINNPQAYRLRQRVLDITRAPARILLDYFSVHACRLYRPRLRYRQHLNPVLLVLSESEAPKPC